MGRLHRMKINLEPFRQFFDIVELRPFLIEHLFNTQRYQHIIPESEIPFGQNTREAVNTEESDEAIIPESKKNICYQFVDRLQNDRRLRGCLAIAAFGIAYSVISHKNNSFNI